MKYKTNDPAQPYVARVVSISADLDVVSTYGVAARGVLVGTTGDLKIDSEGGVTAQTIPTNAITAGVVYPIWITKIYNSGTTATEIVLLF